MGFKKNSVMLHDSDPPDGINDMSWVGTCDHEKHIVIRLLPPVAPDRPAFVRAEVKARPVYLYNVVFASGYYCPEGPIGKVGIMAVPPALHAKILDGFRETVFVLKPWWLPTLLWTLYLWVRRMLWLGSPEMAAPWDERRGRNFVLSHVPDKPNEFTGSAFHNFATPLSFWGNVKLLLSKRQDLEEVARRKKSS